MVKGTIIPQLQREVYRAELVPFYNKCILH